MDDHPESIPLSPAWGRPGSPLHCGCGQDEAHAPGPAASTDVALNDWGDLLSAVKGRLGQIAAHGAAQAVSAQLLECVGALDQLQLTLAHELGRHQQLEREILDTHSTLAQARAELAGTRASESQARHRSLHDSLTTLPNRSHFCERIGHCLDRGAAERPPFAVLYLDLDGFKAVNDAHGHDAGDELLKIVAARLRRAVRSEDMVGRLGGDEFGLLLTALSARDALAALAAKLLRAVATPVRIGALTMRVRASIGIATFPQDGDSVSALLHHADMAMYAAKREHLGQAFFTDAAGVADATAHRGAQRHRGAAA